MMFPVSFISFYAISCSAFLYFYFAVMTSYWLLSVFSLVSATPAALPVVQLETCGAEDGLAAVNECTSVCKTVQRSIEPVSASSRPPLALNECLKCQLSPHQANGVMALQVIPTRLSAYAVACGNLPQTSEFSSLAAQDIIVQNPSGSDVSAEQCWYGLPTVISAQTLPPLYDSYRPFMPFVALSVFALLVVGFVH
ncbi:hypothetical protein EWM64_g10050 [Hericium alpestre]|uniref:Transmembrane protein n=1 Tax=Hericium alpestre TaxID=135208 RepID=A0A4Y9ZJ97_9AGAM|nr:hypothetical protein EWM64_g10050 [Hericium alpestre]